MPPAEDDIKELRATIEQLTKRLAERDASDRADEKWSARLTAIAWSGLKILGTALFAVVAGIGTWMGFTSLSDIPSRIQGHFDARIKGGIDNFSAYRIGYGTQDVWIGTEASRTETHSNGQIARPGPYVTITGTGADKPFEVPLPQQAQGQRLLGAWYTPLDGVPDLKNWHHIEVNISNAAPQPTVTLSAMYPGGKVPDGARAAIQVRVHILYDPLAKRP